VTKDIFPSADSYQTWNTTIGRGWEHFKIVGRWPVAAGGTLGLPTGDRDQIWQGTVGRGWKHFGIVGQWPVATANLAAKFF